MKHLKKNQLAEYFSSLDYTIENVKSEWRCLKNNSIKVPTQKELIEEFKNVKNEIIFKKRKRKENKNYVDMYDKRFKERLRSKLYERIYFILPHSDQLEPVIEYDENKKLAFGKSEGWYEYSKRYGVRYIKESVLVGADDSGVWGRRVPSTCNNINEAIYWLCPRGFNVESRIQGDLYCTESRINIKETRIYGRHIIKPDIENDKLIIEHPEHKTKILDGRKWKFAIAKTTSTVNHKGD